MSRLVTDEKFRSVQVFAPKRMDSVTQAIAWEPSSRDIAFCVPSDCTYQIDGAGSSGSLSAGDIRGIVAGQTYTFDTTMVLEVM
jgi:hypothetical protein